MKAPYEGLIAETVSFRAHNGDSGEAYYARPTRAGKFPGMVVIHHMPGWDEWITEVVRKFALHGYATIAPHLYFRDGPGSPDDVGARVRLFRLICHVGVCDFGDRRKVEDDSKQEDEAGKTEAESAKADRAARRLQRAAARRDALRAERSAAEHRGQHLHGRLQRDGAPQPAHPA